MRPPGSHRLLLDVGDDLALGNLHRGEAGVRRAFGHEVPRGLDAFFNAMLVLADGHRKAPLAGARQRVADQTFNGAHEALQLGFVLLPDVEQLLGAFAVIGTDDNFHDVTSMIGFAG